MSVTQIIDIAVVLTMWAGLFLAWRAVRKRDEISRLRKSNEKLHSMIEEGALQRLNEQDEHLDRIGELMHTIAQLQKEYEERGRTIDRLKNINKQLAKADFKKGNEEK